MNTMWKKIAVGGVLAVFGTLPLLAGPGGHHGPGYCHPHHYGNSGVRLAAEIVGLVRCATAPVVCFAAPPPPVIVPPPPPPPPRVVVVPPPPPPQPYFVEAVGPGFAPPPPPPRHGGWHRHRGPGWRR